MIPSDSQPGPWSIPGPGPGQAAQTEEGWPLDELCREVQKGIATGERHGYVDGEEVFAELLATLT